jgi:cytochrome b561
MDWRNQPHGFAAPSVALHWLMLVLVAAVYACAELGRSALPGDSMRESLHSWHCVLGVSVFVLALLQMASFMTGSRPLVEPEPPDVQKLLVKLLRVVLYALMLGMPVMGWLLLSAQGKTILLLGLSMPALIGTNSDVAQLGRTMHQTGSTLGYILIGFHTLTSLLKHYLGKDNSLLLLLPGSPRSSARDR